MALATATATIKMPGNETGNPGDGGQPLDQAAAEREKRRVEDDARKKAPVAPLAEP